MLFSIPIARKGICGCAIHNAFSIILVWILLVSAEALAQQNPSGGNSSSSSNLFNQGTANSTAKRKASVSSPDFEETKSIELVSGQQLDIIVYLSSLGDPVEKFLIILSRESDNKRIRTLLSDLHGRVRFKNLEPDNYRVSVSRRLNEDGELSTVSVGDVVLVKRKRRIQLNR